MTIYSNIFPRGAVSSPSRKASQQAFHSLSLEVIVWLNRNRPVITTSVLRAVQIFQKKFQRYKSLCSRRISSLDCRPCARMRLLLLSIFFALGIASANLLERRASTCNKATTGYLHLEGIFVVETRGICVSPSSLQVLSHSQHLESRSPHSYGRHYTR